MKRAGLEIKKKEEASERNWRFARIGDNGRESVDGAEAEESADKGITKSRAGARSGLARRRAWWSSGAGMEMRDGRAAVREEIRESGERVWRDNRPPWEREVMWRDRALGWMVAWTSWAVSKMGESGMMAALGWLGTRRTE